MGENLLGGHIKYLTISSTKGFSSLFWGMQGKFNNNHEPGGHPGQIIFNHLEENELRFIRIQD